jgi:hypothetical protein
VHGEGGRERERERVSMEDWWYRNWEKITNWWIFEDREKEAGTWKLEPGNSGQWALGSGKEVE